MPQAPVHGTSAPTELDEEIRFHLERLAQGDQNGDAMFAANPRFGNATQFKETGREMWTLGAAFGAIVQDARYGLRSLSKARGFTAVAVVTLALGVGSSTSIFSLIDAILLKPCPILMLNELCCRGICHRPVQISD